MIEIYKGDTATVELTVTDNNNNPVKLTVKNENDEPIQDATVHIRASNGKEEYIGMTNASGKIISVENFDGIFLCNKFRNVQGSEYWSDD
ncbi:MAG: hypothetical protein FJ216_07405 [Ignavibacteria bacterium]|nr:hypothetical protein [Ignavibacteria bacterium]